MDVFKRVNSPAQAGLIDRSVERNLAYRPTYVQASIDRTKGCCAEAYLTHGQRYRLYQSRQASCTFFSRPLAEFRRFCTIIEMAKPIEADVALLHIAGGGSRITPPPGTLAQTAPRRSARGRGDDMLFLCFSLHGATASTPGLIDHLSRLGSDAYFGTPGSVTSALREAAEMINDHLTDLNQTAEASRQLHGRLMMGALRDGDLYLAQCGMGHAILIRPGRVTRLASEEAEHRPLGTTLTPFVRFYHFEVQPTDLFILTTSAPPLWSDSTLSGLSSLTTAQAADRLVAASSEDLSGVLVRLVAQGEAMSGVHAATTAPAGAAEAQQALYKARARASVQPRTAAGLYSRLSDIIMPLRERLQGWVSAAVQLITNVIARMAPGLVEAPPASVLSTRLLTGTALAVPLIVVAIAAVVYFGRGRSQQFEAYLIQAEAAIQVAQMKSNPEQTRVDWEAARRFLEQAQAYGWNKQAQALWQQTQEALDALDLIARLEYRPVVSGGFGSEALITSLAASETDLYVLDAAHQIIWHAWGTPERGYKIEPGFDCLNGPTDYPELGTLVDIVIQPEPGALGAEGVVAVDIDGTLLYCAPDRQPALAQLTPPDIGWGRIRAIDVFEGNLFVMDPGTNAIWIYSATGGLFSGTPELFFVEDVRELGGAIDMAMAGDELFILYADGRLDRCRRFEEADRIRVECELEPHFQDDRPGYHTTAQIPGAVAAKMDYSPPPEPSLFFLDTFGNSVFHYSMRLMYRGKYLSTITFEEEITAMTLGPPNDLYLAVGNQVYHATPGR